MLQIHEVALVPDCGIIEGVRVENPRTLQTVLSSPLSLPIQAAKRTTMTTPTYSPGLEGVIAGETAICTVEGGLSYRGYFVGDLAANCSFDEVAYLLLYGELPNAAELKGFQTRVAVARRLPPPLKTLLGEIPKWTTPLI